MAAEKNWDWEGPEVTHRIVAASVDTVRVTMTEAVEISKGLTAVRTGALRDSIRVMQEPRRLKTGVVGRWGTDLVYSRVQEFAKHGTPYLRPAAQAAYRRVAAIMALRVDRRLRR